MKRHHFDGISSLVRLLARKTDAHLSAWCRPVVLPDYAELELRIPADARAAAWVCFDGKQR